eukprot:1158057-Pelagomonas_calceolata.AAC.2
MRACPCHVHLQTPTGWQSQSLEAGVKYKGTVCGMPDLCGWLATFQLEFQAHLKTHWPKISVETCKRGMLARALATVSPLGSFILPSKYP